MKPHELIKIKTNGGKRVGRGLGSGKGKTGGRGTKGQKARGKVALGGFVGGTLPLYKRLPFKRGIGNSKRSTKPIPLPVSKLSAFAGGATVDLSALVESGLVEENDIRKKGVKIVGAGKIDRKLTVKLPMTAMAAKKLEKAGGQAAGE